MLFEVVVPFAPSFYKIDLSELPVLICGFAFGPGWDRITMFRYFFLWLTILRCCNHKPLPCFLIIINNPFPF